MGESDIVWVSLSRLKLVFFSAVLQQPEDDKSLSAVQPFLLLLLLQD